jgi:hypothetical protein
VARSFTILIFYMFDESRECARRIRIRFSGPHCRPLRGLVSGALVPRLVDLPWALCRRPLRGLVRFDALFTQRSLDSGLECYAIGCCATATHNRTLPNFLELYCQNV